MGEQLEQQSDAIETLQFLAGSRVRIRLLSSLREQRADARTLVDRLDAPHSTVQRNLNKLEARGWIDVTLDRTYYATPVGEMVLDALDGLLGTVRSLDGLAAFVDCVSFDQFEFGIESLADATVVVADEETPAAPLNEFVRLLDDATGFTLLVPHWNPAYREVIERQLDAPAGAAELITERTQQRLLTDGTVGTLTDIRDDERLTVRLSDNHLSLGIGLVDDQVALAGYREGNLHALVVSDDESVLAWARQYLASERDGAASFGPQVA